MPKEVKLRTDEPGSSAKTLGYRADHGNDVSFADRRGRRAPAFCPRPRPSPQHRYRKAGARKEVYVVAARERLFAKMNDIFARLEVDTRKGMRRPAAEPVLGPDAEAEPASDV